MADGERHVESRRERFARLNHNCMAIHIFMLTPDGDNEMTLDELKNLSTKELTALYNEHADKQVQRMSSRAKLEERTAQLLRENGQLSEGGEGEVSSSVPAKGKKRSTPKPPIEAPTNDEGNADMATATTNTTKKGKTAAKPAASKKGNGSAKPAAAKKEAAGKRGAPLTDHTYKAIPEKSKKFNPGGNKLQASSARGIIYDAIKGKEAGIKRSKLESQFPDQNVKSALDVLVKFGFVEAAAE